MVVKPSQKPPVQLPGCLRQAVWGWPMLLCLVCTCQTHIWICPSRRGQRGRNVLWKIIAAWLPAPETNFRNRLYLEMAGSPSLRQAFIALVVLVSYTYIYVLYEQIGWITYQLTQLHVYWTIRCDLWLRISYSLVMCTATPVNTRTLNWFLWLIWFPSETTSIQVYHKKIKNICVI